MASGEDWKTELQRYQKEAAETLAREHKLLRELIEKQLNSIEDGQKKLLATKIEALSPGLETRYTGTAESTSPRSAGTAESSTMYIDDVEDQAYSKGNGESDSRAQQRVPKQATLAKVQVKQRPPTPKVGDPDDPDESKKGRIAAWEQWWHEQKEPEREGVLANIVLNPHFTTFCTLVILADQAVTVYSTNVSMRERTETMPAWVGIAEIIFTVLYVIEIVLKVALHRQYFFVHSANSGWNLFDFFIVFYSLMESLLASSGIDLSFLRSLRVLKVAKTMKVFRGLGFVDDLRIMIDSLLGCFFKFVWSVSLMMFLMYVFALLFVQSSAKYLIEQGAQVDANEEQVFVKMFGSVEAALFTLYQNITGAIGWWDLYKVLEPTGKVATFTVVFFKAFWMIAVTNIVITVFLGSVMKYATPSLRDQLKAKLNQNKIDAHELMELFSNFDTDESHTMNREELLACLKEDEISDFLAMRGIDIHDMDMFVDMILQKSAADADNRTSQLETLADECFKLRGHATALDLDLLRYKLQRVLTNQQSMMQQLLGIHEDDVTLLSQTAIPPPRQTRRDGAAVDVPYQQEQEPVGCCIRATCAGAGPS